MARCRFLRTSGVEGGGGGCGPATVTCRFFLFMPHSTGGDSPPAVRPRRAMLAGHGVGVALPGFDQLLVVRFDQLLV